MLSKETFEDVPGRAGVLDFAKAIAGLKRDEYLFAHPHPLLIQMNQGSAGEVNQKTAAFATLVPGALPPLRSKRDGFFVYEVQKRPGANAFGLMVTLGRTRNNDVVVDDGSVSKFHASFKKDPAGAWQLTDMSTNGVKLDGVRVPRDRAVSLRSGAMLTFAESVEMLFLMPSDAYDHLQRANKRP